MTKAKTTSKFNSKTKKAVLVSYLVETHGMPQEDMEAQTRKALHILIKQADEAAAKAKVEKKTKKNKRRDGDRAAPSGKTWSWTNPETGETSSVTVDGKRTSEIGCRAYIIALFSEGAHVDRKELVTWCMGTFGLKAKWSALNYIALAKKGALGDAPEIVEDEEGVLRPVDSKKAKKGKKVVGEGSYTKLSKLFG